MHGQPHIRFTAFICCQGFVHFDFIPESKTVNKEMYIVILRRLRVAIRSKRPEKWRTNSWFHLNDNAPEHRSGLVKDFLATK